ncbi:hypothetical protein E2C01_100928 [Portunus trituberculatus]|uniref:Uncharacterized protein n=1 Tax=Portunus trituberculatus TaxID=210409 RepID=A0A5B7KEU7_PORTR|nr:hypothetical protein [Portunus trituberculatus]
MTLLLILSNAEAEITTQALNILGQRLSQHGGRGQGEAGRRSLARRLILTPKANDTELNIWRMSVAAPPWHATAAPGRRGGEEAPTRPTHPWLPKGARE